MQEISSEILLKNYWRKKTLPLFNVLKWKKLSPKCCLEVWVWSKLFSIFADNIQNQFLVCECIYTLISHVVEVIKKHFVRRIFAASFNFIPYPHAQRLLARQFHNNYLKFKASNFLRIIFSWKFPSTQLLAQLIQTIAITKSFAQFSNTIFFFKETCNIHVTGIIFFSHTRIFILHYFIHAATGYWNNLPYFIIKMKILTY